MRLAEVIQQNKLNQEEEYTGDLLAYAMGSTGDFTYNSKSDKLGYTPGGTMPSKTEAWNSYIQMKAGRVTGEDLIKFNQLYTQAQSIQTQNQLQELNKLRIQNVNAGDIQDLVRQNPQMYNNLLDMITNLESTGDENAFQQAQLLQNYLPGKEDRGWFGDIAEEGMGFGDVATGAGIGAAGYSAYQYGLSRDKEKFKKYTSNLRSSVRDASKRLKTSQAELNRMVQTRANMLNRNPNMRQSARDIIDKQIKAKQNIVSGANKSVENLKANIRSGAPTTKFQQLSQLSKKHPMASGIGGALGLSLLPTAGEYLGGEKGREVGRTASNLGWLAMAGQAISKAPHPGAKVLGGAMYGIPALMDLYSQYQGE